MRHRQGTILLVHSALTSVAWTTTLCHSRGLCILGSFLVFKNKARGNKCQLSGKWKGMFVFEYYAASSGIDSRAIGSFNASSTFFQNNFNIIYAQPF